MTSNNTRKKSWKCKGQSLLPASKKASPPPHIAVVNVHMQELTKMDLLLKERGWDQSKFCQIWGEESRCRGELRRKHIHTWSVNDTSQLQTCLAHKFCIKTDYVCAGAYYVAANYIACLNIYPAGTVALIPHTGRALVRSYSFLFLNDANQITSKEK